MSTPSPTTLAEIATAATLYAGEPLLSAFRSGHVAGEYGPNDVKTDIDRQSERRVLDLLDEHVPDHTTFGEETGHGDTSDANIAPSRNDPVTDVDTDTYTWIIDPLDGTNNFAAGYPVFATAVCCLKGSTPVAMASYEPLPGTVSIAARNHGARVIEGTELAAIRSTGDEDTAEAQEQGKEKEEKEEQEEPNGERPDTRSIPVLKLDTDDPIGHDLAADSQTGLVHGTVSYVVGVPTIRDPGLRQRADRIETAVEGTCKRVLESWAPCVDWGLLARGGTEAVVTYRPDPYEQHAGLLLVEEAGATIRTRDHVTVAAATDEIADRLFDVVDRARLD